VSVSFGFALGLFALLLVPLVPLFAWRSRYGLSPRRTAMVTATRALVVTLVVLALADLRVGLPDDALTVAPIVDASASVSGAEIGGVMGQLAALRAPNAQSERREVTFVDVPAARQSAERTDLAPDVLLATAMMAPGRLRRVLLATDGRDQGGALLPAVAAARRAGVRVDVLPLGDGPTADGLLLSRLEVPRLVRGGETLDIGAELRATAETSPSPPNAVLEVRLDDRVIATERVTAASGTSMHRVSVTFPDDEGVHQLEVRASSAASAITANDRVRALVQVTPRPRVLLVHELPPGGEPALAAVLRAARYGVDAVRVPEAPLTVEGLERYALVVLDELDLALLSDAQQSALKQWVERRGGGLVTITGDHAVRREPDVLRALEPVGPPAAIPEPRPLELVLVLDRSSSMDGRPIATARRAAALAVTSLREDAMAGFVAFSDGADHIRQPVPSTSFMELATYINSVASSGGTDLGAALRAANSVVSSDPRYIHHVILLSDGESDPDPALAAARMIAGRGATISVISLGSRNPLMAEIAAIGRGRYHVTQSIGSLPSLMVRESQFRQQPGSRQVSFTTSVVTPSPLLEGTDLASAPPLTGFALSDARREADTLLSAPDGMPLLAHWHRGLGQVATFTSATSGGWADGWRAWPGFHALWSGIARSMLRPRTADPVGVRLDRDPRHLDSRTLTVTGPTVGSEPVPLVRLSRARTGEAETPALRLVGPGVWQAEVSVGDGFVVSARMPWDPEPTAAAAVDHSYAEELGAFGADREALTALAALGGGRVLRAPADVLSKTGAEESFPRSQRFPLLCAALAFYLLGLLLLRLPEKRLALAVADQRRGSTNVPTTHVEKEAA
jgi:uncharacterized protein YegL